MDIFYNMASRITSSRPNLTRAPSADSTLSHVTADASSNAHSAHSSSSTPPTSAADTASISSQSLKLDAASAALDETEGVAVESARPRRARTTTYGSYNVKVLAGTSQHAPKKFRKDLGSADSSPARRRTISGDTFTSSREGESNASFGSQDKDTNSIAPEGIDALDLGWPAKKIPKSRSSMSALTSSPKKGKSFMEEEPKRIGTRSAGIQPLDLAHTLSSLGKRARNKFEGQITRSKRELKRLADTAEFAKIEEKPVFHTVWSNGKFVPAGQEPPARKKAKTKADKTHDDIKDEASMQDESESEEDLPPPPPPLPKGPKKWAVKGFYAGQDGNLYWLGKSSPSLAITEEDSLHKDRPNSVLPLPIFSGDRIIEQGRNFKLPFDVCNPLTERQPKPDEWRRMPKNRFVGDAAAAWKKSTLFDDFSSRCICSVETGCDDSCQNRIMLYECDTGNCKFGAKAGICHNRAFAELQERKVKGGKYNIGVEVIKTLDRGYGVRTNRCFEGNQIITEYTGEIITEDECDRRMNEDYKNNACYYLMSFDQNTILDATEKGSIARFVNHSCDPNCRMVKWVVGGKPRMALFAGERDIMTGEELTYDYNFDPFSAKNVQECRCGSANCRGILGPRPKDPKFLKPTALVNGLKNAIGKGKRKLQELVGGVEDERAIKKRKIAQLKGAKHTFSKKTINAVVGIKRTFSKSLGTAGRKTVVTHKQHVVKRAYKKKVGIEKRQTTLSSSSSSLTIVASNASGEPKQRKKPGPKPGYKRVKHTGGAANKVPRKSGYVRKGGWGGKRIKGVVMKDVEEGKVLIAKDSKGRNVVVKSLPAAIDEESKGESKSSGENSNLAGESAVI